MARPLYINVLKENEFDLCLIDIRTPKMNGTELYEHLEKKYPKMVNKVIFTTGDILSPYIKAFLEKSNRPYLTKPFTPQALLQAIRQLLPVALR
jgi:CheY-like chemotaxis protein